MHAPLPSKFIKSLRLYALQGSSHFFKFFFILSFHPRRLGQPAFCLALDGCPKRTTFGNPSSFIHRTLPSHLNLSFIIAQENGIQSHFSYSLLFKILSGSQKKSVGKFSQKYLVNLHLNFRSAHASEPYLITFITVPSNFPILGCTLIVLLFQTFFLTVKNTLSHGYSTFNIFTAPSVLLRILPR